MKFTPSQLGVLGAIIGITVVGSFILALVRPDASAVLIQMLVAAGAFITITAGVIANQNQTKEEIREVKDVVEKVRKQTNGNTTRLQEQNEYLTGVVAANDIDPETLTRSEYRALKEEAE